MGIGYDLPGLRYARYDGSMATEQRLMVIDEFMHGDQYEVLLMSIKAGNVGLNLVAASHVVIMDPFWNPFIEDQAMDRAHRFGQTRTVYVYRIYIKQTVEDRILTLQKEKKDLVNAALDEGEISKMSRLDRNELLFLLVLVPETDSGRKGFFVVFVYFFFCFFHSCCYYYYYLLSSILIVVFFLFIYIYSSPISCVYPRAITIYSSSVRFELLIS